MSSRVVVTGAAGYVGSVVAELLFDACIRRVYTTEDVAYLAGRICLGLL